MRVIYYLLREDEQIWLLTLYGKDEAVDLSAAERHTLRQLVEAEVAAREKQRSRNADNP